MTLFLFLEADNYEPSDVEILETYDDYVDEMSRSGVALTGAKIWLEAFKRGMRFNQAIEIAYNKIFIHKEA